MAAIARIAARGVQWLLGGLGFGVGIRAVTGAERLAGLALGGAALWLGFKVLGGGR